MRLTGGINDDQIKASKQRHGPDYVRVAGPALLSVYLNERFGPNQIE